MKKEEVYLWDYEIFIDVAERIPYFIEEVYNKKRLHSGYNICLRRVLKIFYPIRIVKINLVKLH